MKPDPRVAEIPRPGAIAPNHEIEIDLDLEISDTQSRLEIDPRDLRAVVLAVLAAEGVSRASISLAIVDDAAIQAINRRHLAHDWPTDVISFPDSQPGDPTLLGELVVSAETAVATARAAAVPAWNELALYITHGLLHLCGYDDTTEESRRSMRQREAVALTRLGLGNTFDAVPTGGFDDEPGDGAAEGVQRWTA